MSCKEVDRLGVIRTVVEQRIGQGPASRPLGLSVRQIKRLVRRYQDQGASGGITAAWTTTQQHDPRGEAQRDSGLGTDLLPDFGPALAGEKLAERHGHRLSAETLRQWMIAAG